ncbi:MAG: hypothetical protein AB8G05_26475 [Oligoflexales bacterium]
MRIQYDLEKINWVIDTLKEGLEYDPSECKGFYILDRLAQIKYKIKKIIPLSNSEENTINRHLLYYPMRIYQADQSGNQPPKTSDSIPKGPQRISYV